MRKITGIGLLVTAALGAGVSLGWQYVQSEKARWEHSRQELLFQQTRWIRSEFGSYLSALRQSPAAPQQKMNGVVASGWIESSPSGWRVVEAHFDNQALEASQNSWWPQVFAQLQPLSLQRDLMAAASFRSSPHVRKDWLAVVFASPKKSGTSRFFALDPMVFFPLFRNASAGHEHKRLMLLLPTGRIIGHTLSAYVGSELGTSSFWNQRMRPWLQKTGQPFAWNGDSPIDHIPSRMAIETLAPLPLMIGLEQTLLGERDLRRSVVTGATHRAIGVGLALSGGLLAVIWFVMNSWLPRRKRDVLILPPAPHPMPRMSSPHLEARAIQNEVLFTEPQEPRRPDPLLLENPNKESAREMVQRFELKSRELSQRLNDRQLIVGMLTEMAARLCSSPTLYFKYRPEMQTAILATDSGFEAGQAPASLSFALDSESAHRIVDCVEGGKIASLSHYEPLSKLLLDRLGTAVFDAWAVTAPGVSGTKLLGVLVILQSGVQSAMHLDSLVRMMRTTGHTLQNIYGPSISN